MHSMEDIRNKLKDCLDIQLTDGNWNYSEYMFGFANGLIFADALINNKVAEYKVAPTMWLENSKK